MSPKKLQQSIEQLLERMEELLKRLKSYRGLVHYKRHHFFEAKSTAQRQKVSFKKYNYFYFSHHSNIFFLSMI